MKKLPENQRPGTGSRCCWICAVSATKYLFSFDEVNNYYLIITAVPLI